MRNIFNILFIAAAVLFAACSNDAYDTGDGAISAMRADFGEVWTDAGACMAGIETDGGERLELTAPVKVSWMEKADTVYRALLYYKKVADGGGRAVAEPLGLAQVLVPKVVPVGDMEGEMKTDPVTFVSLWAGANGKYLNLELLVKTGQADGETGRQTIGIVCDSIVAAPDSHRRVHLSLYHDQNGVPEYYSTEAYVSIPVAGLPVSPTAGDEVVVRLNTYDGTVERTFAF